MREKISTERKQKFLVVENLFSTCFSTKSSWCPEAKPLGARRNERKALSSGAFLRAQKELCSVATGNFAQSFMDKKSKLQIENKFSIHFSAREKVLENQLSVESNLKNYPVDDF